MLCRRPRLKESRGFRAEQVFHWPCVTKPEGLVESLDGLLALGVSPPEFRLFSLVSLMVFSYGLHIVKTLGSCELHFPRKCKTLGRSLVGLAAHLRL